MIIRTILKLKILFLLTNVCQLKFIGEKIYDNDIEITIPQGRLRGTIEKTVLGRDIFTFKGIPYAKPPIGDLRFKEPEPFLKWNGIWNATNPGPECSQLTSKGSLTGEEDCLYLNVAKFKVNTNELLPVMVFIHGGAFKFESGTGYFHNYLVSEDIVYVTINYRLSAFGFLGIEDESLNRPGNAGLKDQILSLKWVQKNIKYFGGNPNLVTIFGESAGGASCSALLLSPITKGLFHRVIYQSGSIEMPWSLKPSIYKELVEVLNCNQTTVTAQFECLNSKTTKEIFDGQTAIETKRVLNSRTSIIIGPMIEKQSKNRKSVLTETPEEIIENDTFNHVPVMAGFCTDEGAMAFTQHEGAIDYFPVKIDFKNNEELIPEEFNLTKGSKKSIELGNRIKQFYYGDTKPSKTNKDPYIKYQTDVYFLYKIFKSTREISKRSNQNVFFYQFNYHRIDDTFKPIEYVAHAAELPYLFYFRDMYLNTTTHLPTSIYRMVKFWTNFAKYGDPNPKVNDKLIDATWLPFSVDQLNYMKIDEKLENLVHPEKERMEFWDQIYKEYKIVN